MMATASIIESFPKNDDIYDAEVDEDSDGGQQQDSDVHESSEGKSVDQHKSLQKDDIFDDEGSLEAPGSPSFDAEEENSDGQQQKSQNSDSQPPNEENTNNENKPLEKDDIFDDEGSEQGNESSDGSEKQNEEMDDHELPKSSKPRSPKPRKLKKAAIQSIHSECQRMLRDSCVKLPYYTPPVKSITHFLKRVPNSAPKEKGSGSKNTEEAFQEPFKTPQPSHQNTVALEKDVTTTPKLSDASDPFFFDATPTESLPTKGVKKLMQRFAKHTKKPKEPKKNETVVILDDASNKEKANPSQQQKKTDIPVPGGRLQTLKQQLEVKMKKQRAELRKIHESQRKLDNEEVSDEEEAEMTDGSSDSDYELDKWNDDDERKQEEENDDQEDNQSAQNEFIDGEADEDDVVMKDDSGSDGDVSDEGNSDDDDNISVLSDKAKHNKVKKHKKSKEKHKRLSNESKTIDLFNGNSSSQTCSEASHTNVGDGEKDNRQSLCLRLDSVEDDEGTEFFTKMKDLSTPGTSLSLHVASDVNSDNSRIEPAQCGGGQRKVSYQESDSETSSMLPRVAKQVSSKGNNQLQPKKTGKLSQLTLPIEDSQDLFDEQTMDTEPQEKVSVSNGFSFAFEEESQFSQLLDTQGFLFSTKKQQKQNPKSGEIPVESSDMAEILGLCSGQFTGAESKSDSNTIKKKPKSLFGTPITEANTQSNMDELLDLCSGMFGSKDNTKTPSHNATAGVEDPVNAENSKEMDKDEILADDDNSDGDNDHDAGDDNDDVGDDKDVDAHDVDDNDNDGDDNKDGNDKEDGDDDDDSNIDMEKFRANKKCKNTYGKPKKVFDKKLFYEEEAELSGSDIGSDEDNDIDTDDDVLEEDSDQEELPSDEELQNQINRVHMKSILDQDKAELRIMQDIYLQDGDLHGEGRKRNFKWRGIDFNSQADLFDNKMWNEDDDNANVELLTEEESKRRIERFERDNFLREEMQKGATSNSIVDIDDNSQVILNIIKDTSNAAPAVSSTISDKPQPICKKPVTPAPRIQRIPSQKGSFLNRSKATLTRLSSITANTPNTSASGRGFVFKTVDEKTKAENNSKKMPRTTSMVEPAAKRPKFDRSMSDTSKNSIFSKF